MNIILHRKYRTDYSILYSKPSLQRTKWRGGVGRGRKVSIIADVCCNRVGAYSQKYTIRYIDNTYNKHTNITWLHKYLCVGGTVFWLQNLISASTFLKMHTGTRPDSVIMKVYCTSYMCPCVWGGPDDYFQILSAKYHRAGNSNMILFKSNDGW
jgi:hypothetical protein